MNAITFDTLKYAKRLEGAGFTEPQAETLAHEQARIVREQNRTVNETLVGKDHFDLRLRELEARLKADLEALRIATKSDLEALRTATRSDTAVVKAELAMVKWLVSGIGFGVLLLVLRSFWPA